MAELIEVIALDDGHGMKTSGKRTPLFPDGTFMHENDFNRAVVKLLGEHLTRCGFKIVFTAPTDDDTPLSTRVKTANDAKVDLFLSVHANALKGTWGTAQGVETFTYGSGESHRVGQILHKHLKGGTQQVDRGVKDGSWLYVVKNTNMPAVLVECAFMDNLYEAKLLISTAFREECALELAKGICEAAGKPFVPKPVVVAQPKNTSGFYRVQIGAYGVKTNADKTANQVKAKGYQPIIKLEGKLYRVQVGAFSVEANAKKLLADLKAKGFDGFIKRY